MLLRKASFLLFWMFFNRYTQEGTAKQRKVNKKEVTTNNCIKHGATFVNLG